MKVEILSIKVSKCYPLRHKMLRKGKPLETCYFDGDNSKETFHLGALVDKELAVGHASGALLAECVEHIAQRYEQLVSPKLRVRLTRGAVLVADDIAVGPPLLHLYHVLLTRPLQTPFLFVVLPYVLARRFPVVTTPCKRVRPRIRVVAVHEWHEHA